MNLGNGLSKSSLSGGDKGVAETLLHMKALIIKSDKDRIVKQRAKEIIEPVSPKDEVGQVSAIVNWVKRNLKYVRDIQGVEEITEPRIILEGIASGKNDYSADCDDFALLISSLLRAVGFRTRLEAVSIRGGSYDHARVSVYSQTFGGWIGIEGTYPEGKLGFRFPSKREIIGVEV